MSGVGGATFLPQLGSGSNQNSYDGDLLNVLNIPSIDDALPATRRRIGSGSVDANDFKKPNGQTSYELLDSYAGRLPNVLKIPSAPRQPLRERGLDGSDSSAVGEEAPRQRRPNANAAARPQRPNVNVNVAGARPQRPNANAAAAASDQKLCGFPTKKKDPITKQFKPCTRHGRAEYDGRCNIHKDPGKQTVNRRQPNPNPPLQQGDEPCNALNYWGPNRGKRCRRAGKAIYHGHCHLHKNYNQPGGLYSSPEDKL